MRGSTLAAALLAAMLTVGCAQPAGSQDTPGPAVTPVDAVPGNLPPLASLQATPGSGRLPLDVVASFGARDPEGDGITWSLDFGDGSTLASGDRLPAAIEHTYTRSGSFRITLVVSDGQESSQATVTVRASATQATSGPPATATSTPSPSSQPSAPAPTGSTTSSTTTATTSATTTTSDNASTTSSTSSTTTDTTTSDTSTSATTTTTQSTTTTSDASSSTTDTSTSESATSTTDTGTPPPGNGTGG